MEPTATERAPANPESHPLTPSYPSQRRVMASSTLLMPCFGRSRFKTVLWISLGLTALFVFITSEVLLVTDYPMYHAYRLQVIADRRPPGPPRHSAPSSLC